MSGVAVPDLLIFFGKHPEMMGNHLLLSFSSSSYRLAEMILRLEGLRGDVVDSARASRWRPGLIF